jgi:hypothetical protein
MKKKYTKLYPYLPGKTSKSIEWGRVGWDGGFPQERGRGGDRGSVLKP